MTDYPTQPRAVIYQVAAYMNSIPQGGTQMAAAPLLPPPAAGGGMSAWRRLAIVASTLEVAVDIGAILALWLLPDPGVRQNVVLWALALTGIGDGTVMYGLMQAPIAVNSGDPGLTRTNLKNALNAATVALLLVILGVVLALVPLGMDPTTVSYGLILVFIAMLILDGTAARLVHTHA